MLYLALALGSFKIEFSRSKVNPGLAGLVIGLGDSQRIMKSSRFALDLSSPTVFLFVCFVLFFFARPYFPSPHYLPLGLRG